MADSIEINKLLRAFLEADGFAMDRIDPKFELYFDDDGDIVFNEYDDWYDVGSNARWRDLFEFVVKYVNKERL